MAIKVMIMHKIPANGFNELGDSYNIVFPKDDSFTTEELEQHLPDTQAIVSVFGIKLNKKLVDMAPNLKLIANYGVGYDNIDVEYVSSKGITVTNTPDPVTEPTAELAMGLMVATSRSIGKFNTSLKNSVNIETGVMKNLSSTLFGKTLGIIGMGAIGQSLAKRAAAFGMSIIYHNRRRLPEDIEKKYNTHRVSFDVLLKQSDVVSLNTPLNADTFHMMKMNEFKMMKESAIIINTARGSVIKQDDLIDALQNGIIAGAGLDVYENEPHIPDALLNLENTVLTPHTGTATLETRIEMSVFVSSIIKSFFNGNLNKYIVNEEELRIKE